MGDVKDFREFITSRYAAAVSRERLAYFTLVSSVERAQAELDDAIAKGEITDAEARVTAEAIQAGLRAITAADIEWGIQ